MSENRKAYVTLTRTEDGRLGLIHGRRRGVIAYFDSKSRMFFREVILGYVHLPRLMTPSQARHWVNAHFQEIHAKFPSIPEFKP